MIYKKEVEIDGKLISIEYGRYARQSNAAVMVTSGQTMVLVVVTMAKDAKEDIDFFPLSVHISPFTKTSSFKIISFASPPVSAIPENFSNWSILINSVVISISKISLFIFKPHW